VLASGVLACAGAVILGGCGGSRPAASGGTAVAVTERDFHISTTTSTVPAGDVVLRVHNEGPDQHELIVVPERPGGLKLRTDGFTVNEEAIQNSEPGSLVPGQPGSTRDLKLNLKPGRYVLFCNMSGHFLGGMHMVLVVSS
jgi:uncharacterized cupredoxin-like copper-binding protein